MSKDRLKAEGRDMARFIAAMPADQRDAVCEKMHLEAQEEHEKFKAAYTEGRCYLCGDELTSLDENKPCIHWLLNPPGFKKKKHFRLVTEKYGFHAIQSYLRWLANEDKFAANINDLVDEGSGKLREVTIRYKDLEWSFSTSESDFNGHGSGAHQMPHYHFQMKKGLGYIIRFNDFHVPFSDVDVRQIEAEMTNPAIRQRWSGGEGMDYVFQPEIIEHLIDHSTGNPNGEGGEIKYDHFITADEGTTMSGEDIYNLYEESKRTGVSMAKLLKNGHLSNVSVTTIVTPGPAVVEQSIRSGRGNNPSEN